MSENMIVDLSFTFSLQIIEFCEMLEGQKKFVVANQLLKSGTSIGANIREAQNPYSKADFVSKMIISLKEAEETEYWLLLCKKAKNYPDPGSLLSEIHSIKRILGKIVSSGRRKQ